MLEGFTYLRWQDAVDIGIIAFALCWLIHMIEGTYGIHYFGELKVVEQTPGRFEVRILGW